MGTEYKKYIRVKGVIVGTVWVTHRHPRHYQAVMVDGTPIHSGKGWVTHTGYVTVADAKAAIMRHHQGGTD